MIRASFLALSILSLPLYALVPRPIPPIATVTASNKAFHLDAHSVKKPTLLVFWASWCEACRRDVPLLIDLQKKHGNEADIIGVNLDEDFNVAEKFIKKTNINYENIKDGKGKIADAFFVAYTPMLIAVDTKGQIVKETNRFQDIKETLLSLISQKKAHDSSAL
jgi:cytochrome c biogenesis protein CcmG/thiol:disulfide interchange protein DsbE